VDWKAEYSALSSTRSQKKKLKQPTPKHCAVYFFRFSYQLSILALHFTIDFILGC